MARQSDIRIRRSAVAGAVPGGADLNLGELALNTADGAVYVKNGAGNIVTASHDGILHYDEPNSRIGIGTTNPTRALEVNAASTTMVAQFKSTLTSSFICFANNSSTADQVRLGSNGTSLTLSTNYAERVRIDSTGRLGIGTTTPTNPIELSGAMASSTSDIFVTQTGTNTVGGGGGIKFSTSATGGTNTNYWSGMTGTRSSSDDGSGELRFFTTKSGVSSNAAAEKMIITQDGYVGIGTSNPGRTLDVTGDAQISSTGATGLRIVGGNTSEVYMIFGDDGDNSMGGFAYNNNTNELSIDVNNSEAVRIDSSGRVNIGNATNFSTADGDDLQVGNTSGSHGITIVGQNTATANLFFGDNNNNDAGAIRYNHSNNGMAFYTDRTQRMVISSTGAVTFNQAFTFPTAIGVAGQILKVPTSGTDLVWAADDGGSTALEVSDTDGDTKIQVEEGTDDDTIRFDVAGTELMTMTAAGITVDGGTGVGTAGGTFIVRQKGDTLSDGIGLTSSNGISHRIWKNGSGVLNIGSSSNSNAFQQDLTGNITIEGDITVTSGFVKLTNNEGLFLSGTDDSNTTTASRLYRAGGNATRFEYYNNQFIFDAKSDDTFSIRNSADTSLFTVNPNSTAAQSTTIVENGNLAITNGTLNIGGSVLSDNNRNISIVNATSTGVVKHADGAASAPSITFTDDTDKGIYSSSDGLNIATGGTRRAYFNSAGITSTGNVYTSSTGEFRNYSGVWEATAGLTGNGFAFINSVDGTAATISSTGNAVFSGTLSSGNITTTGYLRGPSTFTIDPAGHGDNTGTVVIAGNLQIDGTTTSINSTTLDVDDINITVAKGAANAAAANGAGLTVDGANANITYTSTTDEWDFNKSIHVSGASGSGIKINSGGAIVGGGASGGDTQLMYWGGSVVYYGRSNAGGTVSGHEFRVGGVTKLNVNSSGNTIASGNVGIGTSTPQGSLSISNNGAEGIEFFPGNQSGLNTTQHYNRSGTAYVVNKIIASDHRFNIGGTEKVRINSSGFVGIGTSSPLDLLHINSSTSDARQIIDSHTGFDAELKYAVNGVVKFTTGYDDSTASYVIGTNNVDTSKRLVISNIGNVGIGTGTPNAKLTIEGGNSLNAIKVTDSGGGDGFKVTSHSTQGTYTQIYDAAHTQTIMLDARTDAATRHTYFNGGGNVGIGTTSPGYNLDVSSSDWVQARFKATSDGYAPASILLESAGSNRGQGIFQYNSGSKNSWFSGVPYSTDSDDWIIAHKLETTEFNSDVAQMGNALFCVNDNGNVGIGTTTPAKNLEISYNSSDTNAGGNGLSGGVAGNGLLIRNTNTTGGIYANLDFRANNADGRISYKYGATNVGDFHFITDNLDSIETKMIIQNGGNVGIGNTNPSDYSADANNLVVGSLTGNNGITIASSGSSGYGSIYFADSAVGNKVYSGFIRYQHDISDMTFGTNEVERMRLTLEGYLGIGTIAPKAKLQVEEYGIDTTTTSSTAVTQIAIHTFPIADFRSARFTVQITNSTDSSYHSTEMLAIHDGTTANITEFGEVHTGTSVEATFDADVSSTNFRLLATPSSTDSMTFKVVCHSLTV